MPRRKPGPAGLAATLCAVAALGGSGCSFMFVDAPPDNARNLRSVNELECTASRGWPTTDVIAGGVMGLETLAALSESSSLATSGNASSAYLLPAVAAASAALFVASGVSGYRHTSECRSVKRELTLREFPSGPPGTPPRGFAPGFTPYPAMAPPPYDPWTAQPAAAPAAPPPSGPPTAPGGPAWGAPPPPSPNPAPPAAASVPPIPPPVPPGGGGW